MKRAYQTLVFVAFSVFCVTSSAAQELSPTAKLLKVEVEQRHMPAIVDAASTGDVTLIPYLRTLIAGLSEARNPNHTSYYAQVGLAKLGDADAIKQILAEVDDESPAVQDVGMGKLRLVGGKTAYKKLYGLLDDVRPRENIDCQKMFAEHNKKHPNEPLIPYCDVVYFTRSVTAMMLLRRMVSDPPVTSFFGNKDEIRLWKAYLERNQLID